MITIDIGNTTTQCCLFENDTIVTKQVFATLRHDAIDQSLLQSYRVWFADLDHQYHRFPAVVCSVVPKALKHVLPILYMHFDSVFIAGQNLPIPLRNGYAYPEQVGTDRLLCAYAVWSEKPEDYIVVDFGTAITIDWVSKAGVYMGGVIAPGLEVSLEALASRTALLPRVNLEVPPEVLGRQTEHSIQSGLVYGTSALCDGLIRRLREEYAPQAQAVATGGFGAKLLPFMKEVSRYEDNLVHLGLYQLMSKKENK